MRDLIGRITDSGGHRGTLIISELEPGEAFEGSHAQQTVYVSMKEQGVPKANILAHGPGITNWRVLDGAYGLLTPPGQRRPARRDLGGKPVDIPGVRCA